MPVACSVAAGLLPALRFARLTTKRPVLSTPPSITGSVSAAISSVVVKLLREYTGRGPTKARTYVDDDLITVVLRDTLTMGERSLVRDGEVELVLATRTSPSRPSCLSRTRSPRAPWSSRFRVSRGSSNGSSRFSAAAATAADP